MPKKKCMFFIVYICQVLRYVFRIRLLPQPNHHISSQRIAATLSTSSKLLNKLPFFVDGAIPTSDSSTAARSPNTFSPNCSQALQPSHLTAAVAYASPCCQSSVPYSTGRFASLTPDLSLIVSRVQPRPCSLWPIKTFPIPYPNHAYCAGCAAGVYNVKNNGWKRSSHLI